MREKIKSWLLEQQNDVDKLISGAAVNYYKDKAKQNPENFKYDLKQCHIESYNLMKGKDLCYDRPPIAFSYSLWYQPRRINTFLSFFLDKLIQYEGQNIEIFDLGAGAGAIQWSLGLIYVGMKKLGLKPPKISVINIDTSAFMLDYNKSYMWPLFKEKYPEIDKDFIAEYEVNSWTNQRNIETSNPILAASYLFDSSDNKEEIAMDFKKLVEKYKPNTVLLITSRKKIGFLSKLKDEFKNQGFIPENIEVENLIFNNELEKINKFRSWLSKEFEISELRNRATWVDMSYCGLVLSKPQANLALSQEKISKINLFNPPIVVRREISLNEEQIKASQNNNRRAVIVGPAGCGKSIVITEKIKNIVVQKNYSPDLKILCTTFNKDLVGKLGEWLIELLDDKKYDIEYDWEHSGKAKSCKFTFKNSDKVNIRLLHFDKLPQILGGVKFRGWFNHSQHMRIIDEIIKEVKSDEKIVDNKFDNILNSEFLFEEYHRVIYGLGVGIRNGENSYLSIGRKGRGSSPSMKRNSYRRKIAWLCLLKYANKIHNDEIDSFTLRRQYFYDKLKEKKITIKYDYILVDEFQDCTDADFEIFNWMIKDYNNLTIAGDLAQSVHLGTTAKIPKEQNSLSNQGRNPRRIYRLDGSYRLPVRVSEAIKDLSSAIVKKYGDNLNVLDITPYKSSPPGSRPIIVYAENNQKLAVKIKSIFNEYKIYDLKQITILERDIDLKNEIHRYGIKVETDSILKLKGLEKECVVWSTSRPLEFEKEVLEFSYTILTRTSCILIVGLTNRTQKIYKKVIGMFDKEKIIIWDKDTEENYDKFCEPYNQEIVIDED